MRCPTLHDLPPPSPGKIGWPWTVESPQLPDAMPDGKPWPRISIVTPSYNQGQFIEETIRSVLLQGFPDLEYIIIDGGSTDESADIVKKYEPWLSYWVSERDTGQAHAINKGLARCTGHWFQNINSDDILNMEALRTVGEVPLTADLVCGHVEEFSSTQRYLVSNKNLKIETLMSGLWRSDRSSWHQPGVFLKRELMHALGGYPEEFQYVFDLHLICRYLELIRHLYYCDATLVFFRIHPASKSSAWETIYKKEAIAVRASLSDALRLPRNRTLAKKEAARRELHMKIGEYFQKRAHGDISNVPSFIRFALSRPSLVTDRMFLGALVRMTCLFRAS